MLANEWLEDGGFAYTAVLPATADDCLVDGVIGSTTDFDSVSPGSSPGRPAFSVYDVGRELGVLDRKSALVDAAGLSPQARVRLRQAVQRV